MAFVNLKKKEVQVKIVYYGPGRGDFLPFEIGKIGGYDVKIQLYTVPGQVKYNATRRLVLRGVDGIVFVADSMAVRREKNILSVKNLKENLSGYKKNLLDIPVVIQYNKVDLSEQGISLLPKEILEKDLNQELKAPSFEASALQGTNVVTTMKKIIMMTMTSIQNELK
ncbi:MAG: GTPase domain-containing protein [Deltaproteobacteria bacterium]|nr:GTPase domain-containing protein [Deltaproteobacteria bacterium]